MSPEEFISTIKDAAMASMAITKIPASFVIAEGALESAWGKSQLVVEAKNIFGVKADPSWTGETYNLRTREFVGGRFVIKEALWRKYDNWLDCISDHAKFLMSNKRYAPAFAFTDGVGFAEAVAAAGYATDPDYAEKLVSIIHAHYLLVFDTPQAKTVKSMPSPKVAPLVVAPAPAAVSRGARLLSWMTSLFKRKS